jgi:xanthine dehydrogenase accessory factor
MDLTTLPPEAEPVPRDPVEAARLWLTKFDRVALATVIATWGSSPVPVGGQLVIAAGERFAGSVSGGCIEGDVIAEAESVVASGTPRVLQFGISDETAWQVGLPCGGNIEILVERLEASRDLAYLDAVLKARAQRSALVVRTRLSDGAREVFDARAPGDAETAARLSSGRSDVVETAEGRVFLHALAPVVHVIVVGATHVGQVLADLAGRVGYKVSVVDPRSAFTTDERFGSVPRYAEWPEAAFKILKLDARTAVVALTHVGRIDDEALVTALRSDCMYIGALGSRRNHSARVERLAAAGVSAQDIARIHGPIGLAIGARGPEEIAVSILAEIVKVTRGA